MKNPLLPFSSLRTQIVVWNVVTLAVLIAGMGLVLRYTVRSFLTSAVNRELERQASTEVPPQRPSGDEGPPGPPPDGRFGEFRGHPPPRSPLRPHEFDLTGRSMRSSDNRPAWDPAAFAAAVRGQRSFTSVESDGEPLQVLTEPRRNPEGAVTTIVQAAYSLKDFNLAMANMDRSLVMMIPIALLGAGLGGSLLTNRVLRRVRDATQAAKQISIRDLSARLPVEGPVTGSDEFSQFARTFNGLLGRLEFAFEQQKRSLQQQRRFTADASHELKTPLTVIKGTASMTLAGAQTPETYARALREIDEAADSMSHLVQDLLLLARFDAGQLGRNRIELPLREVMDGALSSAPKEGPPIDVQLEDEALCVFGNQRELVRLFSNLLANAARHTPKDGWIRMSASVPKTGAVVVSIADNGTGIAPEHIPHLGERFYRVDAARSRPDGGAGLGLSICKGIAAAHRGTLTIESAVGGGTTVRVLLPCSDLA